MDDRQSYGGPDIGSGADCRCRLGLRHAAQGWRQLQGLVPFPRRPHALVRGIPLQRPVQMLRLRQGRQRRALHHGARTAILPRRAPLSGPEIQHRNQGTRTLRRRETGTERTREHVRGQRMGQPLLPGTTQQHRGRTGHRHGLFPFARIPRRHHQEIPTGLQSVAKGRARPRGQGTGIQAGIPALHRTVPPARQRAAGGPFPRPRHLSRTHAERESGGLRRTGARRRHQGRQRQVPELSRIGHLFQEERALRPLSGQAGHRPPRPLFPGGRLHRRHLHAPDGGGERGVVFRHGAHHGTNPHDPPLHGEHHRALRRRRGGHQSLGARHRHAAGRGDERETAAPARRRRPRQFRPQA